MLYSRSMIINTNFNLVLFCDVSIFRCQCLEDFDPKLVLYHNTFHEYKIFHIFIIIRLLSNYLFLYFYYSLAVTKMTHYIHSL